MNNQTTEISETQQILHEMDHPINLTIDLERNNKTIETETAGIADDMEFTIASAYLESNDKVAEPIVNDDTNRSDTVDTVQVSCMMQDGDTTISIENEPSEPRNHSSQDRAMDFDTSTLSFVDLKELILPPHIDPDFVCTNMTSEMEDTTKSTQHSDVRGLRNYIVSIRNNVEEYHYEIKKITEHNREVCHKVIEKQKSEIANLEIKCDILETKLKNKSDEEIEDNIQRLLNIEELYLTQENEIKRLKQIESMYEQQQTEIERLKTIESLYYQGQDRAIKSNKKTSDQRKTKNKITEVAKPQSDRSLKISKPPSDKSLRISKPQSDKSLRISTKHSTSKTVKTLLKEKRLKNKRNRELPNTDVICEIKSEVDPNMEFYNEDTSTENADFDARSFELVDMDDHKDGDLVDVHNGLVDLGHDDLGHGDLGDVDLDRVKIEDATDDAAESVYKVYRTDSQGENNNRTKPKLKVAVKKRRKRVSKSAYKCTKCPKRFQTEKLLSAHQDKHDINYDELICPICNKQLKYKYNFEKHMRLHADVIPGSKPRKNKRPYSKLCDLCGQVLTSPSSLRAHLTTHYPEKTISCEECGKMFKGRQSLMGHMSIHTGVRPFSCQYCGHIHTAFIMSKMFKGRQSLMGHMSVHTGVRPFSCQYCSMKFRKLGGKQRHERVHTGERPFQCRYCDKTFPDGGIRQGHEKVHLNIRAYVCKTCGQRFTFAEGLKKHMRTHTDERPYGCETCGKRFRRTGTLIVHLRTHTGERPYCCPLCGKTFAKDLHQHMKTHKHKCSVCDQFFLGEEALSEHLQTAHLDDVTTTDAVDETTPNNSQHTPHKSPTNQTDRRPTIPQKSYHNLSPIKRQSVDQPAPGQLQHISDGHSAVTTPPSQIPSASHMKAHAEYIPTHNSRDSVSEQAEYFATQRAQSLLKHMQSGHVERHRVDASHLPPTHPEIGMFKLFPNDGRI